MKKFLLATVAGTAILLPIGGVSFAESDNHLTPGTPGEPNCVGQTMAFWAQAAKNFDLDAQPGVGNFADLFGLSNKELKALAQTFCNP
jgi:hypothetical protein